LWRDLVKRCETVSCGAGHQTAPSGDADIRLAEIIALPIFGEVTKLELLYFVLYHTQRHIHQLKKSCWSSLLDEMLPNLLERALVRWEQ